MSNKIHPYKIIWHDHSSRNFWRDLDEVIEEDAKPFVIESIGWLIYENKEVYVLATSISENGRILITLTILKNCVVKKQKLKF